jgi:ornithine cyclodeaminase/alanine dehydrogenase-like protein (mu-crystallin family)
MAAPGQHLDLVGAFTHAMREATPRRCAARWWWSTTRGAARAEAGDLAHAAAEGWSWDELAGDLADAIAGRVARDPARPTLFKSVGLAFEDLVLARLLADAAARAASDAAARPAPAPVVASKA